MDNISFKEEFNRLCKQEIKLNRISPYIHEYSFPFHDLIKEYKDIIIKKFYEVQEPTFGSNSAANFPTGEELGIAPKLLTSQIMHIVRKYYIIEEVIDPDDHFGLYVQNKEYSASVFHNHINTPNFGAMVGTFYIDPPNENEGGGLSFMFHEKTKFGIPVKKDKLYLFPNWVLHAPLPQAKEDWRICFNYSIYSIRKPLNKFTGDIW